MVSFCIIFWYYFKPLLKKVTEIGIDEITPIITDHSERKIIQPERINKILISAMKQSVKAYLPKLNEAVSFNQFISNAKANESFIAHCQQEEKKMINQIYKMSHDILILIGPEGDFSRIEIEAAKGKGFKEVSLGHSRLRTETAGIVACHTINYIYDSVCPWTNTTN